MIEVLGCLKATSRCWFVGGEVCWPCAAAAFLCSKQPPVVRRGSKKVRLVETRAAWPFQIEGAAGWCRGRAQVAIGAVFPVAAAVAVGPRCPPATALEGLALGLSTSPKLDLMRRMEKKERMRLDEEGRCAARRTREVPQREQFSHGTLETCSSRRGPETGPSVPRHTSWIKIRNSSRAHFGRRRSRQLSSASRRRRSGATGQTACRSN